MRYVLIALMLAGCATPEQRIERGAARAVMACEKIGYASGTPENKECAAKLMQSSAGATRVDSGYSPTNSTCQTVAGQTHCRSF